jgi:hypothetical protein
MNAATTIDTRTCELCGQALTQWETDREIDVCNECQAEPAESGEMNAELHQGESPIEEQIGRLAILLRTLSEQSRKAYAIHDEEIRAKRDQSRAAHVNRAQSGVRTYLMAEIADNLDAILRGETAPLLR